MQDRPKRFKMRVQDLFAVIGGKEFPVPVCTVAENFLRHLNNFIEVKLHVSGRHVSDIEEGQAGDTVGMEIVKALSDAGTLLGLVIVLCDVRIWGFEEEQGELTQSWPRLTTLSSDSLSNISLMSWTRYCRLYAFISVGLEEPA